jgi:23S rRNA (pseudouridine1915-N3)-methyltransferase
MIKIICLGRIKDPSLALGIQDFVKRLDRLIKLEIVELKDAKVTEPAFALKEEAKLLDRHLLEPYFLLDEKGTTLTSMQFAELLKKHEMQTLTFIIGSAHGFDETLKSKAKRLSLSPMTWTHQMARLEQIYRGICINKNLPYHKK